MEHPDAGDVSGTPLQEDHALTVTVRAAHAAKTEAAPIPGGRIQVTSKELLARIIDILTENKAEDIVEIDLRGKTVIGDFMVVCSGRSSRQVSAISDILIDRLKADLGRLCKVEGKAAGDWVLIDTGDVIVHIFRPEVRDFYQLEKMWLGTENLASGSAPR